MGRLAVTVTVYFQVIILDLVAGSLRENLVCLFYYYTIYYYVRILFGTVLNCILYIEAMNCWSYSACNGIVFTQPSTV